VRVHLAGDFARNEREDSLKTDEAVTGSRLAANEFDRPPFVRGEIIFVLDF